LRQSHQNINYQSNLRSTTKEEDIAAAITLNCSFNQNKYEMLFSTSELLVVLKKDAPSQKIRKLHQLAYISIEYMV
jgi:hypothetical protein